MRHPTLESHPATGQPRGIAVFCHGGAATGRGRPNDLALSLLRMRAIEQHVHHATADRGIASYLIRYRNSGWNGGSADAYVDLAWALDEIRGEHGHDLPIVLVGHSMGGRAALRAGGDRQVTAVCALAPWTPSAEPVGHLRGQTVAILHGREDRWVSAQLSADFAVRARRAGAHVARFTTVGGHSMLRRVHRWHTFARDVVLGGAGLEPMRPDIANALQQPSPEGLAVPL